MQTSLLTNGPAPRVLLVAQEPNPTRVAAFIGRWKSHAPTRFSLWRLDDSKAGEDRDFGDLDVHTISSPAGFWGAFRRSNAPKSLAIKLQSDEEWTRAVTAVDLIVGLDDATQRALELLNVEAVPWAVLAAEGTGSVWDIRRVWALTMTQILEVLDGEGTSTDKAVQIRRHIDGISSLDVEQVPSALRPWREQLLVAEGTARALSAKDSAAVLEQLRVGAGAPTSWMSQALDVWVAVARWKTSTPPTDRESSRVTDTVLAAANRVQPQDPGLAIMLTSAAVHLVFHRSRTAEVFDSPLVSSTTAHLESLRMSTAWTRLRDESTTRPGIAKTRNTKGAGRKQRLLILPGAYGQFHRDIVEAVGGFAVVRTARTLGSPDFTRRRPNSQDLLLLDALRQGRVDLATRSIDGEVVDEPGLARQLEALAQLARNLRPRDVVLGDWADASTMWASHVCPKGVRLVIRLHSLDLLDPWLHLIDWRAVQKVVVTTPSMRSLYSALCDGSPSFQPASVLSPYRPDLGAKPASKTADASTTLGMVGWGRLVKRVDFALDLLDRDPVRKLVLIGPGFGSTQDDGMRAFEAEVRRRIEALGDRVHIVGQTDDVAGQLANVGFILSSSTREGWHLGLIEGAASGAVPVVRDWPLLRSHGGAKQQYPQSWVVNDVDAADARIREVTESGWERASEVAREQTLNRFDPQEAQERILQVLLLR